MTSNLTLVPRVVIGPRLYDHDNGVLRRQKVDVEICIICEEGGPLRRNFLTLSIELNLAMFCGYEHIGG